MIYIKKHKIIFKKYLLLLEIIKVLGSPAKNLKTFDYFSQIWNIFIKHS